MEDLIFALDIGTRSVTGILLRKEHERYKLVDYYMKEYKERYMKDGQIHHVIAVSEVIQEVKNELEKRQHLSLSRVSVAAAGRTLKTMTADADMSLKHAVTSQEAVRHLELTAVHHAQELLTAQQQGTGPNHYYCVGYSVLRYKIDGEEIGSLIDQNGENASVEIIATFLPKVVVESLLAALERANLEMEALTLEPIAAIKVLIPESMRRLNVALVDIGAGTSDIAITDKGTVVAYGMVPVAGDEITEAISDQYLLDFKDAEQTKRKIVNEGKATVADILGFETTITYDTLVSDISAQIENLAEAITDEILRLNGRSPRAVMLIGGGSLTPELPKVIARKLQLPENRVAVRGLDTLQHIELNEQIPKGPDYITPIGIAISANENPVHYIQVKVNDNTFRLFELKRLTIGDCLVHAGINIKKWYGRPGMASFVKVNGKDVSIPGELGEPPKIFLNGKLASVDDVISENDEIKIQRGKDGKHAQLTLGEFIGETSPVPVYFENEVYKLKPEIYVNGEKKDSDYIIRDGDEIKIIQTKTAYDFIEQIVSGQWNHTFPVYVNGEEVQLEASGTSFVVNDEKVDEDYLLKPHDRITILPDEQVIVETLLKQLNQSYYHSISVTFNGEPVTLQQENIVVERDGQSLSLQSPLSPFDELTLTEKETADFIFQDVFRYVDIDMTGKTGNFSLYRNGEETTFYSAISDGDHLEIRWE